MTNIVFLLDTNVLSNAGLKRPPLGLRPWMSALGANSFALSFPVITELRRGAHLALRTDPQRAERLQRWIDAIMQVDFRFAEMTVAVSDLYAHMTTVGPLKNLWCPDPSQKRAKMGHDLMIAALAITHQMPIATSNVRDFVWINEYFPLPGLFDPVRSEWHIRTQGSIPPPLSLPVWSSENSEIVPSHS